MHVKRVHRVEHEDKQASDIRAPATAQHVQPGTLVPKTCQGVWATGRGPAAESCRGERGWAHPSRRLTVSWLRAGPWANNATPQSKRILGRELGYQATSLCPTFLPCRFTTWATALKHSLILQELPGER